VLRACCKSGTKVRRMSGMNSPSYVTRVSRGCFKSVTRVLQECCKGVKRVLQERYESVTRCVTEVRRMPGMHSPSCVIRVSRECYKSVTRVLRVYRSVTIVSQKCHMWVIECHTSVRNMLQTCCEHIANSITRSSNYHLLALIRLLDLVENQYVWRTAALGRHQIRVLRHVSEESLKSGFCA
jgi:hypothetical protein